MTTAAAMTALTSMRDNIATGLQTAITEGIATVKVHRGRFDFSSVQRYATRSPFIAVAYLGSPGSEELGDSLRDDCNWAAYIVVHETATDKRDEMVLALNGLVKSIIRRNRWGNANAQVAKRIQADNLHTTKLDEIGVELHVVSWEQPVTIPPYDEPATLNDFNTLFTEYDLAESLDDDTEADDTIDLTG